MLCSNFWNYYLSFVNYSFHKRKKQKKQKKSFQCFAVLINNGIQIQTWKSACNFVCSQTSSKPAYDYLNENQCSLTHIEDQCLAFLTWFEMCSKKTMYTYIKQQHFFFVFTINNPSFMFRGSFWRSCVACLWWKCSGSKQY